MRIVKWDEFQKLSEGTIFQEVFDKDRMECGEISILGEMVRYDVNNEDKITDFLLASLTPNVRYIDSLAHDEREKFDFKKNDFGLVVIHPNGFGRDGIYDHDNRKWMVWENADRERLAHWLLNPDKALAEQNDLVVAIKLESN